MRTPAPVRAAIAAGHRTGRTIPASRSSRTPGPVTVQPFDDLETALDLANGVEQGLAASVWTRDHGTAMELVRRLEFGCVWINTHLRFASEMPHGGFGVSGHGKELSIYALDEYSRIKHAMTVSGAPR